MSFDRLAPHYTWMEAVLAGRRLQRSRVAWLEALADCKRLLVAGVGHGHFLRACGRRFPKLQITAVDASAVMLRQAERRTRRAGIPANRLAFIHATVPEWRPDLAAYDAIATHFFLDCFAPVELALVIDALADGATGGAKWVIADFCVPAHGLARQRARAVHALMYAFFRRAARLSARHVTEPDRMLRAHGFTLAGRRTFDWGLLRSDLWARAPA